MSYCVKGKMYTGSQKEGPFKTAFGFTTVAYLCILRKILLILARGISSMKGNYDTLHRSTKIFSHLEDALIQSDLQ